VAEKEKKIEEEKAAKIAADKAAEKAKAAPVKQPPPLA